MEEPFSELNVKDMTTKMWTITCFFTGSPTAHSFASHLSLMLLFLSRQPREVTSNPAIVNLLLQMWECLLQQVGDAFLNISLQVQCQEIASSIVQVTGLSLRAGDFSRVF